MNISRGSFTLSGTARAPPSFEPSFEDGHVFEADISQSSCRTGTRSLVRSRTIRDDQLVARQLVAMQLNLVDADPQGSRQLLIGLSPGLFVPGIDQDDFLSMIDPVPQIDRSGSRRFHILFLSGFTSVLRQPRSHCFY